ncbi:MAG: hypothetical protein HYX72_10160 [Acidobacteria bacterium]|nr:hypothetical protein [Acidobacteriota bacterium]
MARLFHPVDAMGTLYTSDGLRLAYPTSDFLLETAALEEPRPGVRSEIVTEARYLVVWVQYIAEIGFLISVLLAKSALVAFAFAFILWFLEEARYRLLGPYIPYNGLYFSKAWAWLRYVAFPLMALQMWPQSKGFAILIAAFSVYPVFSIVTLVFTFAVSLTLLKLLYLRFGEKWYMSPGPAIILRCTIERWKRQVESQKAG